MRWKVLGSRVSQATSIRADSPGRTGEGSGTVITVSSMAAPPVRSAPSAPFTERTFIDPQLPSSRMRSRRPCVSRSSQAMPCM